MTLRTRIDFTQKELAALLPILANSRDDLDQILDDRVSIAAGQRAIEKVERAHRKATTGHAADPDIVCNTCNNRGETTVGVGGQKFGCRTCGHLEGQHPNSIANRLGSPTREAGFS